MNQSNQKNDPIYALNKLCEYSLLFFDNTIYTDQEKALIIKELRDSVISHLISPEKLAELKGVSEFLLTSPITDFDVCMCGLEMNLHNPYSSGHSPVSMGDYAIDMVVKQLKSVISDIESK